MPERADLSALSNVAPIAFEGQVWRVALHRHQDKILSTEGNRYFDGRYHRAGETGILYTSCEARTAGDEVARHAPVELLADGLAAGTIKVVLTKVLDLTQHAVRKKLGLSKEILMGSDYSPTQALSLQARRLGIQGLIVPSAAGVGYNLIIFEDNLSEGCSIAIQEIKEIPASSI